MFAGSSGNSVKSSDDISKGKDSVDGDAKLDVVAASSKHDGADTLINFENEELSSSSFSSSYSGDLLHFQNASEDLVWDATLLRFRLPRKDSESSPGGFKALIN